MTQVRHGLRQRNDMVIMQLLPIMHTKLHYVLPIKKKWIKIVWKLFFRTTTLSHVFLCNFAPVFITMHAKEPKVYSSIIVVLLQK